MAVLKDGETQPSRRELRNRIRFYSDRFAMLPAALLVIASLFRSNRRPLWIGDSHAVTFLRGGTWAMFLPGPHGEVLLRVGARLIHSLARRGFPHGVHRFAHLVKLLGRRDAFLPVYVAGEIDVRNSLAARLDQGFDFVTDYVSRVRDLTAELNASTCVLIVPPPPAMGARVDPHFPRIGTDEERLAAFQGLRAALHEATSTFADVALIDLTNILAGDDGMLRDELTDDGCHTNGAAQELMAPYLPKTSGGLSPQP